jgi:putative transposase
MFRINRFQELMKGLPRGVVDRLVDAHGSDKHSKGFTSWDHLIAMVYAQLAGVSSLRELTTGFNAQMASHYHLGVSAIKRSTLADANSKRSDHLFADIAQHLMGMAHRQLRRETEEFVYLLDATSLTLKGRGLDEWTLKNRTRDCQGLKVHVEYAQHEQIPTRCRITAPTVNDISEAQRWPIESQAKYVFDKGYYDYNWWNSLDQSGAFFVTRFKYNAALVLEKALAIPQDAAAFILADEIVRFKHRNPRGGKRNTYEQPLRRITVVREGKKPLIFATNDMISSAQAIAKNYQDRWQIELFFKWIKQHLKIKRFIGCSENAIRIQIYTALISYLLVAIYKQISGCGESLWECLIMIRATLFQRSQTERELFDRRRREREDLAFLQAELCL